MALTDGADLQSNETSDRARLKSKIVELFQGYRFRWHVANFEQDKSIKKRFLFLLLFIFRSLFRGKSFEDLVTRTHIDTFMLVRVHYANNNKQHSTQNSKILNKISPFLGGWGGG